MIVEFKLDTKDAGDLAVIGFLFEHLKVDQVAAPEGEEAPPKKPKAPGKKRGPKPKQKKGAEGKKESEIKEMNFKEMDSYLLHKEADPTDFEVRWLAKLFKKEHGVEAIREIINELDAHNFTDLPKEKFKKFSTLLCEKYTGLATDAEEAGGEDLDLEV